MDGIELPRESEIDQVLDDAKSEFHRPRRSPDDDDGLGLEQGPQGFEKLGLTGLAAFRGDDPQGIRVGDIARHGNDVSVDRRHAAIVDDQRIDVEVRNGLAED